MATNSNQNNSGVTRRQFMIGTGTIGAIAAMPLLGRKVEGLFEHAFEDQPVHGVGTFGEEFSPDRIMYTTCEQCNSYCTIKVALTESKKTGQTYVRKIAGNPYSPFNTVPFGHIDYATDPAKAAKGHGNLGRDGRSFRGGRTCLKGQAGIQTAYDAYRIAKPLKRVGPRGSGKWVSLSWEQALKEIGEKLKPSLGYVAQNVAMADWDKVKKGEMTQADFDTKYKDTLVNTKHPDLGPKTNEIAFLAGDRVEFITRITNASFGSINVYNHGSICGGNGVTSNVRAHNGTQAKNRMYADLDHTDYLIAWGTNLLTANKAPTWTAPKLTNAIERGMKLVVVDPRLSKTAEKAHLWVPVKPGMDTALAFGMIRWIIENKRYDARYLTNPNKAAATADQEPTWSDATYLVNLSNPARPKLKAADLGIGAADQFVVLQNGQPAVAATAAEGDLEVDTTINGMNVKSAFTLLKERVFEHTLAEYAEMAGVAEATIVEMAREFTSYGKRAVVSSYRGPAMHTNGFYAIQAINALNFLIGNHDWKGGENSSVTRFKEFGGVYDLKAAAGGRAPWGIPISREKSPYEKSSIFARDGYPAKRQWYNFGGNAIHEIIPSAYEGYPYNLKAMFISRTSPVESIPGGQFLAEMLKDDTKIPLLVAFDIVVGGTSQYADYLLPDTSYLERFGLETAYPNQNIKESHIQQPIVKVMDGPRDVQDVLIDLCKALGLPGVGDKAFKDGSALNSAVDYYLKLAANVAYDGTPVPDASPDEQKIFITARQKALGSNFDYAKWRGAVKPEEWAKVVFVLNRGGRFAPPDTGYDGEYTKDKYGSQCNFYDEAVAKAKNSYDGKLAFDGTPKLEAAKFYSGKEVADKQPLAFVNWKSSHLSMHRTIGNAWLREIRHTNPVWMNPKDAAVRGLKDGDRVRIKSANAELETEVYITEGIRPGVVGADFSYGHETFGAKAMEIDGVIIPAVQDYGHTKLNYKSGYAVETGYAKGRGTGIRVNDLNRQDETLGGGKGTSLVDSIGGGVSQLDTKVEIVKL